MQAAYMALVRGSPDEAAEIYQAKFRGIKQHSRLLYGYARLLQELNRDDDLANVCELLRDDPDHCLFAAYQLAVRSMRRGARPRIAADEACTGPSARYRELVTSLLLDPAIADPVPEVRHIAICGTSYCGSTLLDRLLNGMDGVCSIGESHWLTKSYDGVRAGTLDYLDPYSRYVPQCSVCGADCQVLTARFRASLGANPKDWYFRIARQLGADKLVSADKNLPKIVLNDPLLRCDALVLFKSPKQAWASEMSKRPRPESEAALFDDMQKYMAVWRNSYGEMLEDLRPQGLKLFVSFDDLASYPETTLRAIADGFSLAFEERALVQSIPGHSIGGNDGSMRRLRESNYAVRIEPLPPPAIPEEHAAWIDAEPEINELYHAMRDQALGVGAAGGRHAVVVAPSEAAAAGAMHAVGSRLEPFALQTIEQAWLEGIFCDFGERANEAAAALEDTDRAGLVLRRDFFIYLADNFDAGRYADLQRRHLMRAEQSGKRNHLKYIDTVRWIEGKFSHALSLRLHRPPSLDILDLGTGPGHFQVVAEYFGHRTLGLDVPLKAETASTDRHLYDDLCDFFGVEKVTYSIKAMEPLPEFDRKFDLVTSFMSWFNCHSGNVPWSIEEWSYFLCDVRDHVLKPGGRLYMNLVKESITPQIWDFLASRATSSVERNCTLLFEDLTVFEQNGSSETLESCDLRK